MTTAMQIVVVPDHPFQQNCSVLWCERTRRAAIVDPGGDLDRVLPVLRAGKAEPSAILLTHAHLDPRCRDRRAGAPHRR